jgi:hypothetical protein
LPLLLLLLPQLTFSEMVVTAVKTQTTTGSASGHGGSNAYKYNICNGLSNQLLYHSASIAVAVKEGKEVLVPDYFIVNGVQHTDDAVLPTDDNSIPFGDAFDQEFFIQQIQKLGIRATFVTFDSDKPQIPCQGMNTFHHADPRVVFQVLNAFRPSKKIKTLISGVTNKIKDRDEGICLHHRDGEDWHDHCARWGSIKDGVYRGNCLGVPGRTFLQSLKDRGLTDSRWIYYCGDHEVPKALKTSKYTVLSRDDLVDQADIRAVEAVKNGQPIRDLWALIDFFVCGQLKHFIGNSVSTFSAIQIALRDGNHVHWYNSQSIPLGDLWRIYQIPIVYTYTELSAASGKHLLQASISSVRQQMPSNKIHILYHGDDDKEFRSWLREKDVIIHRHRPTWKDQIETMRQNGDPSKSHLFLHAGNYLGTWQRIDIPLFIDSEYCLLLDADTIVLRPFTLADFGLDLTPGIAMSAEYRPDEVPSNAGVTLMNVPHMRQSYFKFLEFILKHVGTGTFNHPSPSDQGAYLEFYDPVVRFLSRSFNFKPYWKGSAIKEKEPFIVHFHGAKPHDFLKFVMGGKCDNAIQFLCDQTMTLPYLCLAMRIFARASVSVDGVAYCTASFTKPEEVAFCNYMLKALVSTNDKCAVIVRDAQAATGIVLPKPIHEKKRVRGGVRYRVQTKSSKHSLGFESSVTDTVLPSIMEWLFSFVVVVAWRILLRIRRRSRSEVSSKTKISFKFLAACICVIATIPFLSSLALSEPVSDLVNIPAPFFGHSDAAPAKYGASAIFFNAFFVPDNEEEGIRIVREQLDEIASSYITSLKHGQVPIYFNTFGSPVLNPAFLNQLCATRKLSCELLSHHESASEEVSLQKLYDFCQDQEDQSLRVAYLHNKGSVIPISHNGTTKAWTGQLTAAAMTEQCWNPPDDTCNVCGLLFWPMWSTFFPGNMWTAKCSYVRKLLPPTGFDTRMGGLFNKTRELIKNGRLANGVYPYSEKKGMSDPVKRLFGVEHFALEHWVGSHPDLQPCDVSGNHAGDLNASTANGRNENDFVWSMAPHHPLLDGPSYWWALRQSKINTVLTDKERRMREYFLLPGFLHKWIYLYNETPPASSWVWSWYPDHSVWRMRVNELGVKVLDTLQPERIK